MPKITISYHLNKVVNYNLNNDGSQSVLAILRDNFNSGLWTCLGIGRWTTLLFLKLIGKCNFTNPNNIEIEFLAGSKLLSC